jgi:hypothetical protein
MSAGTLLEELRYDAQDVKQWKFVSFSRMMEGAKLATIASTTISGTMIVVCAVFASMLCRDISMLYDDFMEDMNEFKAGAAMSLSVLIGIRTLNFRI